MNLLLPPYALHKSSLHLFYYRNHNIKMLLLFDGDEEKKFTLALADVQPRSKIESNQCYADADASIRAKSKNIGTSLDGCLK